MDINRICIIRAKLKDDYFFDGIRNMGYKVMIPYKDRNLFLRCLREIWFRSRLPVRSLWYNSEIMNASADVFIIYDPLITPDFVTWVRDVHPQARIIVSYENRADRTISPDSITDMTVEKWSYDAEDCRRYSTNKMRSAYLDIYCTYKTEEPKFDVVYVGRDKGRTKELFALRDTFERMGLNTYFHICADRQFLCLKHQYYKPLMRYQDYLKLIARSKAILNIMPKGQTSITMRDLEVIFHQIKGITNNKAIKDEEFYHPSRFFILDEDPLNEIPKFLSDPFIPLPEEILEKYRFKYSIADMLGYNLHC